MSEIKFGFTAKQIIKEGRVSKEEIEEIKVWLCVGSLPKLTDEQIVVFLIACSNQHELTKKTIEAYYSLKKRAPEVFDNRLTDRIGLEKALKTLEVCVLPEKTNDGCLILCMRLSDPYHGNFDLSETIALVVMVLDAALHEYPPKGLIILWDLRGVGLMHLTKLKLGILKIGLRYFQEALPVRLVEIHVLNTVYFMDMILGIFRPFIGQKLFDMLHFHPSNMDMKQFHQSYIPKRCLPEDYGGDLLPLGVLHTKSVEKLTELRTFFEAEESQRHRMDIIED